MLDRNQFLWRPNDNSVTTKMRYGLEAKHWTEAFRSASAKPRIGQSTGDMFMVFGILFSIFFWITGMIAQLLIGIIAFIFYRKPKPLESLVPLETQIKISEGFKDFLPEETKRSNLRRENYLKSMGRWEEK